MDRARRRGWAVAAAGVVALVTVGALGAGGQSAPPPSASSPVGSLVPNASVERVVDGDTVDLVIEGRTERVRLIGIDTPETVAEGRPVQCYGPEATERTRTLLPAGTPVLVERDAEPRDDYGRLLGYVHRAADGLFVNLDLVRSGHATVLTIEPNTTHARAFVAAARDAETADRGLWGVCGG